MIKLADLIYIKKGFLTNNQCDLIINEINSNKDEAVYEHCPHSIDGKDTWSKFTRQEPRLGTPVFNLIHKSIEQMVQEYHDYTDTFNAFHVFRRFTMLHPHMYRIMRYDKGAWIHPHTDHDPGVYGSCTINLNDDYTGGDFSFWHGQHKVKLEKGDAMIWPADYYWVHEVEEITNGTRYSVNCFLCNSPRNLPEDVSYDIAVPAGLLESMQNSDVRVMEKAYEI